MSDYTDAIQEFKLNVARLEEAAHEAQEYLSGIPESAAGGCDDAVRIARKLKAALLPFSPQLSIFETKLPAEPLHLAPFMMEKTNDKGGRVMSGACMARWRQGAWRCDRCSQMWPQGSSGPPCKTAP